MNIRHWNSMRNDWTRALNFYREELHIHHQRLAEIAAKHTDKVLLLVEYYEAQFLQHVAFIEKLLQEVYADVAAAGEQDVMVVAGAEQSQPEKFDYLEQQYLTEEKDLLSLRQSFSHFCATWI